MQAVRNNAEHVPYGKSCLTRLLADCMGYARSRVVLIATCRSVSVTLALPDVAEYNCVGREDRGSQKYSRRFL